MGIRRNGNLEKKSLQGFSRRNGNSKKWESFPRSCTLTQNGNLTDPRVYASRLKKTVCSVLEKILSGREQITISDSLRTDLKPAAYLNLNFSNVQIWRKPNDGLVYGQTDPIVSPMRIICFLRLVIRQWTWIPGQCVVWSVCELFCKKCIYCR